MIDNVLNQYECKKAIAGEAIYHTDTFGNVLIFVTKGKLIICNQFSIPVAEVVEGNFILLPEENNYIINAATPVETILIHAGSLSSFITEDPEWNPETPVVLPIIPSLAETLEQLKKHTEEKRPDVN